VGKWLIDADGHCMKGDQDLQLSLPGMPNVISDKDFAVWLAKSKIDHSNIRRNYSYNSGVPCVNQVCPICKKGWNMRNCYAAIELTLGELFHQECYKQYINKPHEEQFQHIFQQAGFGGLTFATTENMDCNSPRYADWFRVGTDSGITFVIGWLTHVITVDWSSSDVDFRYLFTDQMVTMDVGYIHAHGAEKAVEYLTLIRAELKKPEVQNLITKIE